MSERPGLTVVGWANLMIFQWFFFRLAYQVDDGRKKNFAIIRWIVPMTGWFKDSGYWVIGHQMKMSRVNFFNHKRGGKN